jgi:hypothetical protein
MTETLYEALKRMSVIRERFVVRNLDGTAKTDKQAVWALARICRLAGLPERQWHTLRSCTAPTTWLGHKRIDETMLYVHVAGVTPATARAGARSGTRRNRSGKTRRDALGCEPEVQWQPRGSQTDRRTESFVSTKR